jgi:hypothetical protein
MGNGILQILKSLDMFRVPQFLYLLEGGIVDDNP